MAICIGGEKQHSKERMGEEDIRVVMRYYRSCVEVRSCIDGA